MDAATYTNHGEEVPLGVECALPCCAGTPSQDAGIAAKGVSFPREIETFGARPQLFPRLRLVSD